MSAPSIVEHAWRGYAAGIRHEMWNDWQAEHGVEMDKPALYEPSGSTKGEVMLRGHENEYVLRTGHVWTNGDGRNVPAKREAFPEVDGARYRVVYVRGEVPTVRALRRGARQLRPWTATWRRVTNEAAYWFPEGGYYAHSIGV